MVDFVKIAYRDGSKLRMNPLLYFETIADSETLDKQVKYDIAKYKGLKFTLWEHNLLLIEGSLHKYFNNDEHNHNDFPFSALVAVLKDIERKFELDLKKCTLQNIEFGVNVKPFGNTSDVLDNLICHKTEQFESTHQGNCKRVVHRQYYVKIYNKAEQNKLQEQKMRFELSVKKMAKINHIGVRCLHDLLNTQWIEPICELLLDEWNNVLLFDTTIDKSLFSDKKKDLKLAQWQIPNFWLKLDKFKRSKELKKYKDCVQNCSSQIHSKNGEIIKNKWLELANS